MSSVRRRAGGALGVAAIAAGLMACDKQAPVGGIAPSASYSTAIRSIAACPASTRVPAAVSALRPRTPTGSTAVLRVGDAVTVEQPAGARIGFAGARVPGEAAVLCRAGSGRRVDLVARTRGYVRVAVVAAGAAAPAVAFVRVTS